MAWPRCSGGKAPNNWMIFKGCAVVAWLKRHIGHQLSLQGDTNSDRPLPGAAVMMTPLKQ